MAKAVVEEHKDEEDKSRRDKRPNLSISTEPLGEVNRIAQVVYRETDKYSITPTTFFVIDVNCVTQVGLVMT